MKHVERKEHNKGMKVFLFEKSKYSGKTKIKTIRSCKLNHFFSVIKKKLKCLQHYNSKCGLRTALLESPGSLLEM